MKNPPNSGESQEHRGGSWLRRRRSGPAVVKPEAPRDRAIWTDSHCHLQDDPDSALTLASARARRVGRVVCAGTDEATSRRAVSLAAQFSGSQDTYPQVWATVGLHPHDAKVGLDPLRALLEELSSGAGLAASRVVAIGECGLDYHYEYSPRDAQREVFAAQVALANEKDLALVIHTREAWEETFAILESEGVPARTIFHCFNGGEAEAKQCLWAGAMISFSGIVTFGNAEELRRVVVHCPVDSLMVETDSPYLTPVPHRGKPNEPANVVLVGETVARLKDLAPEVLAAASWANTERAFGLGG